MTGQKPRKVLELVDNDNTITKYYVLLNAERTKFTMHIVSSSSLTDDDIYQLTSMFVDERDGLPINGEDCGGLSH